MKFLICCFYFWKLRSALSDDSPERKPIWQSIKTYNGRATRTCCKGEHREWQNSGQQVDNDKGMEH